MSKGILSILLVFTLIGITLPPPASAQQAKSLQPERQTEEGQTPTSSVDCAALLKAAKAEADAGKEKKSTKGKIWGVLKDPADALEKGRRKLVGAGRQWTKEQQCQALIAKSLFATPLHPPKTVAQSNPQEVIYNPANPEQARTLLAQAQEIEQKYANRQSLTPDEEREVQEAYFPFFRYAEAVGIKEESQLQPQPVKFIRKDTVLIPPRTDVRMRLSGGCMDAGLPAAPRGEKLHMVFPDSRLLPSTFQPIYSALMRYAAEHTDEATQAQVQRIVWNMRHGCFRKMNELRALRLQKEDEQLLDSLVPGTAATFKKECQNFDWGELGKEMLRGLVSGGTRLDFNPVGLVDANQAIIRTVRQQEGISVREPLPENDNSDYSLLQDGVAIKNEHPGGAGTTDIVVRNTTDQLVEFTPVGWTMEGRRSTQRIYIRGISSAEISIDPIDALLLATMFMPGSWLLRAARAAWLARAARLAEASRAAINPKIYVQLEKQLAKDGAKSIFKALRSAEKRLQEHKAKLPNMQHKSQVEGTIRNVERQVETIKQFIKDKGLK
jgi:hypothetical protein